MFSLSGGNGTVRLDRFGVYFPANAASIGAIIPTDSIDVGKNVLGKNGEWRNGALTIQAVLVKPNDVDGFTTDPALSNGGTQGAATSGLLWEATIYHHWGGDAYHEAGNTFVPGEPVSAP